MASVAAMLQHGACLASSPSCSRTQRRRLQRNHTRQSYKRLKAQLQAMLVPMPPACAAHDLEQFRAALFSDSQLQPNACNESLESGKWTGASGLAASLVSPPGARQTHAGQGGGECAEDSKCPALPLSTQQVALHTCSWCGVLQPVDCHTHPRHSEADIAASGSAAADSVASHAVELCLRSVKYSQMRRCLHI